MITGENLRALFANNPIETLESRLFYSVTTWTSSSFSAPPSSEYSTVVQVGDNGDLYGMQTSQLSNSGSTVVDRYQVWDSNPWDGIDSGVLGFTFTVNTSGSATFSIDGVGDSTVTGTSGAIGTIDIRAGVADGGLAFTYSGVMVYFYSGTTLVDSQDVGTVEANTLGGGSTTVAGAYVSTSASNVDRVVVNGSLRIQTTSDNPMPWGAYVRGDIAVLPPA